MMLEESQNRPHKLQLLDTLVVEQWQVQKCSEMARRVRLAAILLMVSFQTSSSLAAWFDWYGEAYACVVLRANR